MRRPILIIAAILLALGVVEGVAYWWMHPAPAGLGEPVLVYRPGSAKELSVVGGQLSEKELAAEDRLSVVRMERSDMDRSYSRRAPQEDRRGAGSNRLSAKESSEKSQPPAPELTPDNSPSPTDNRQQTTDNSPTSTLTPLPEIYAKSAPMLRCSSGQVLHARLDESAGIHLAFFEWDGTDTGSVLEAFRHMPEACMGSIGLKLVEKAAPRSYVVGGRGTGDRLSVVRMERSDMDRSYSRRAPQEDRRGAGSNRLSEKESSEKTQPPAAGLTTDNRQLATDNSSSPTDNRQQTTDNSSSSTLTFDHTVFREGGGVAGLGAPIHAFRAVWVSGIFTADARKGLDGDEFNRLRTIRLKSALNRFRPAHARVIQGAVRGIANPDLAWQAFEETMLKDLSFQ